jgi:hypothetical protein
VVDILDILYLARLQDRANRAAALSGRIYDQDGVEVQPLPAKPLEAPSVAVWGDE